MDLTQLKWTKNIKREDGEWAYSYKNIDYNSKILNLHWKLDNFDNAGKPEERDLIILRQKGKVTHVVEFLNNSIYKEEPENNWIYRLVKVIWMTDVWSEPPHQNDVFDCSLNLQGGNAIKLENIRNLRQKWDNKGGMPSFQKHIQKKLKL